MPIFNRITYGPVEAPEAYAVFDSSDGSFTFFRDTPGKYTDGQVSGTKTYYTGFEDITGNTTPSWFNSSTYRQKNTIKTTLFKDKIKPKTCYRWFYSASSLTSITGLNKLDTANVTDMSYMFSGCTGLTSLDASSFNTAAVTNMDHMFYNCYGLTGLDVSSFNTAAVTSMGYMFYGCRKLTGLDVSGFNTANVTDMNDMFYNCYGLTGLDVSGFNTANVTDMGSVFEGCSSLTSLDVSNFNTENVTNMWSMFNGCSKLKTIYASSLFTTNAVSWSVNMFAGCTSLVGGAGTTYDANHKDKAYARIDGGTSRPGYFTTVETDAYAVFDSSDGSFTFFRDDKGKYTDGQVRGTKTYYTGFENITGKTDPSWYDSSTQGQKNTIKTVTFKDKIKPKTCYDWFSDAVSLTSIIGLDKLDTENVTNMYSMFYDCNKLTSLDLSNFNTEKVTNMQYMFTYNSSLKTIYASSLFTTDAVSMSNDMFYNNVSLVGGAGTKFDAYHTDKAYARIDGGTSNPGYFTAK